MAYAAAFLGIVAAAAPVGGSPYSERSPHHQRLYDAYETSKTLCSHGHSGVIITLYGRSQKTPEEFMKHLRSNAHATDSFGHVFSSPHTIRAISARLSARTLEQMMKDQYANYVVQKMLDISQGPQRDAMLARIRQYTPMLRKFMHGKHIIARIEKAAK
jgi:hypothetical protein